MSKKQSGKPQGDERGEREVRSQVQHQDRADTAKKRQKARDHIDRWESLPRNLPWDE